LIVVSGRLLNLAGLPFYANIVLNQQPILIKPLKKLVMKYKFYIVLLACIVSFGTQSCKKEQVIHRNNQAGGYTGGNTNDNNNTQTESFYFLADNWQLNPDGIYVHTFQTSINADDVSRAKAYIPVDGHYMLPINTAIGFSNGTIWATFSITDVKVNFRCNESLPFASLKILVKFE
jgi:hypothetical protein